MHPYLLFHSLAEIASATISFGTFLFAWNTRRFHNPYLLTVGAAALFVGLFEVLHCLAFPGMSVFPGYDENLSPLLWMSARALQAGACVVGLLLLLGRRARTSWLLSGFAAASVALGAAVFLGWLPDAVVKPRGLTPFKVAVEWCLVAAFLSTVGLLLRARARFAPRVLRLLVAHAAALAGCEVCFTLYLRPYGFANLLGHVLLLAAGTFQYLAIIRAGLVDPDETHFRELHQSEATLRGVLDATQESVWLFEADGTVRLGNQTALWRVGRTSEEVVGRDFAALVPEPLATARRARLREVLETGKPVEFEDRREGVDFLHCFYPVLDADGRACRVAAFSRDVTQRKAAENALRQHELVVQQSRDAILFVRRDDGRILAANPAAAAAYGYRPEELLGLTVHDLRAPGTEALTAAQIAEADARGLLFETLHRRKDGSTFPVEVSSRGAATAGTRTLVSVIRDITERRRAEAREHEQRQRAERRAAELDAIFDSLAEPLLVTDAESRLVRANPAFARLFGGPEDFAGLDVAERVRRVRLESADGQPLDPARAPGLRALRGETVHGAVQRLPRADGSVLHLSTSSAPIRTAAGIVGAVVVFADVTERVRAEQVLRETDRRKDEFLAVLSHELRNPLAPIHSSLHVLELAPAGSDVAGRAMAVIRRQATHLTRLVEDLLDVTRIARGKVRLQRQPVDLAELVRRTADDYRATFQAAGVALEVRTPGAALHTDGDPTRLAQLVGNLLGNAVKFTPRGGAAEVSLREEQGAAVLRVRDDGVGMELEVLGQLFRPFSQVRQTLDRSRGGLGLGLALVKGLAELHGGSVAATSDGLGLGSEFSVWLPLQARAGEGEGHPPRRRAPHRRILVIDDNDDLTASLRDVLELGRHEVAVACDGPAGIALARKLRPEVVLCDIGLPGMDGYAVARALRAEAALEGALLVALSGYALPADVARAGEAGFDLHVAKPLTPEKLEELLCSVGERFVAT
jgi:PAS domain S-box-containing protein